MHWIAPTHVKNACYEACISSKNTTIFEKFNYKKSVPMLPVNPLPLFMQHYRLYRDGKG